MYVEYQVPAQRTRPYPIILIHGHGQSGVGFQSTPDGREGWAVDFLRMGYAVYVVDQPMRGRSAYFADTDGPLKAFPVEQIEKTFTDFESANAWPQARLHSQWPDAGTAGGVSFDQFYASQLGSTSDLDVRLDELNRDDGAALLDKIGPAIVLTHSRSGPFGWLLADARPDLVKAIVAIEPWGPPFRNFGSKSTERPWGLTIAPLTFDPPAATPSDLAPEEESVSGAAVRCWFPGGVRRTLPKVGKRPILLVTGEASYHRLYDRCTSEFLTRAGVGHTWWQLGDEGIHGNGHMMMLEKNSAEIAVAIDGWLTKQAPLHAVEPR